MLVSGGKVFRFAYDIGNYLKLLRLWVVVIVFMLFMCTTHTQASDFSSSFTKDQKSFTEFMGKYIAVSAAVDINERCSVLNKEATQEFQDSYNQYTEFVKSVLRTQQAKKFLPIYDHQVDTTLLAIVEEGKKKIYQKGEIKEKIKDCNANSKRIVMGSYALIQGLVTSLDKAKVARNPENEPDHSKPAMPQEDIAEKYALIAGAWYMNQRCSILTVDEAKEFEWNVSRLTITMGKFYRGKQKNIPMTMQKIAKETSESEEYRDCNAKPSNIVRSAFELSKELSIALGHQAYRQGASEAQQDAEYYTQLVLSYSAVKRCNLLDQNIADQVDYVYHEIQESFAERNPEEMEQAQEIIDHNIGKSEILDCESVQKLVKPFLTALNMMETKYLPARN